MSQGQKRKKEAATRKWRSLLLEQGVILLCYLTLFLISALIAYRSGCKKEQCFYFAGAAFALSAFVGAAFAAKRAGKNGLLTGLQKTALCNTGALISAVAAAGLRPDMRILISAAILIICASLGGIFGVNLIQKPRFAHHRGRKK